MEIGTLNQRITLLEQRVKVDAIGNHCNRWEEAFSCWARVTLKSSVENADTGVTKEVQTLDFYIRQQRQWMPSTSANRICAPRRRAGSLTGEKPVRKGLTNHR